MVLVPASPFMMGSGPLDRQAKPDEVPAHRVTLRAFYIDRFEVTQGQYRRFLADAGRNNHRFCDRDEPAAKDHTPSRETWNDGDPESSRLPVVGVDWFDAAAYCAWAGKRLPTEAEWEKAARGTDDRRYPWGDDWNAGRANGASTLQGTAAVGSYPTGASPYGAHDMAGNVVEWVSDWFDPSYYQQSPERNPTGPSSGQHRAYRGGTWFNDPVFLRAARRPIARTTPDTRASVVGFRCAKSAP